MASIAIFVFMVAPLRIFCCLVGGYCGFYCRGLCGCVYVKCLGRCVSLLCVLDIWLLAMLVCGYLAGYLCVAWFTVYVF